MESLKSTVRGAVQIWFEGYIFRCNESYVDEVKALLFDIIIGAELLVLTCYLLTYHVRHWFDALAGLAVLMIPALRYLRKIS